jgi:hypothetical protein
MERHLDPDGPGKCLTEDDIWIREDDGSVRLWTSECSFVGDGENNRGWVCNTDFGQELVKPDRFAVEQALKTYYAERLIRKTKDARFFAERVDFADDDVFNNISRLIVTSLPKNWLMGFMHQNLPVSYRVLAFQISFIRYHYPDIYEQVWSESFDPECLREKPVKGALGIVLGEEASVLLTDDPLLDVHPGSGALTNAGIACSNIGLLFRGAREAAEPSRVIATFAGELPDAGQIAEAMAQRKKEEGENTCSVAMFSYEQLELEGAGGTDLIQKAAELAFLSDFTWVSDPLLAAAEYYAKDAHSRMEPGEKALVFYLDESGFMTGVVQNCGGQLSVTCRSGYVRQMMERLDEQLYGEMEALFREIMTLVRKGEEEEILCALRESVPAVRRQFIRNDSAVVAFQSSIISASDRLSVKVFEGFLRELVISCDQVLRGCVPDEEAASIKKLYLAGSMTDYPALWKLLEEEGLFGGKKELAITGHLNSVVAEGLALMQ